VVAVNSQVVLAALETPHQLLHHRAIMARLETLQQVVGEVVLVQQQQTVMVQMVLLLQFLAHR
jgi:hypothetical protein